MLQQPLFAPASSWKPTQVRDLPDWSGVKRLSFDVETYDPNLKTQGMGPGYFRNDGYAAGYGFAIEGGKSFYLPVRHEGGGNLPLPEVLNYLRNNASQFRGELIGANLPYDEQWSRTDGILFPNVAAHRDIQIAAPLVNELPMDMSLEAVLGRLGLEGKYEHLLNIASETYGFSGKTKKDRAAFKDVKKNLHKLHSKYVGEYCERDCTGPLEALRLLEKDIDKHNLWDIWNLESKVLPVLLKYQQRGVLIDLKKLEEIENWSKAQEGEALKQVFRDTGIQIGLGCCWTKEYLIPVFKQLGIHLNVLKTKSSGQIDYQIDQVLFSNHSSVPAVKQIAWARKVSKLQQFAASVRRSLCPDGRIHCKINQIAMENEDGEQKGARYGRTSCINPNLQQQPSRDEFAKEWRSIYIPEPGAIWGCHDYSQQEPRWVTHFAASTYIAPGSDIALGVKFSGFLKGAAEAAKAYCENPMLDNHDFMSQLTGLPRKAAKLVYLGLCYGEGGAKLCHDLGLPTEYAVHFRGRGVRKFKTQDDAMAAASESPIPCKWYECAGEEGQKILDTFDARAPFIRQLAAICKFKIEANGTIRTAGGRLLHFPQKANGEFDWTHKGLNRVIQGTSADQNKQAMVDIDRELPEVWMQLPVHDELDGSHESPESGKKVTKLMMECMGDTKVPFRVDAEYGPNWGYIEAVKDAA